MKHLWLGLELWYLMPILKIFQLYHGSQFYWSIWREPLTCHNFLTNFKGLELTTLVMIGTDCTGSCKSNHHTITITMAATFMAGCNYPLF